MKKKNHQLPEGPASVFQYIGFNFEKEKSHQLPQNNHINPTIIHHTGVSETITHKDPPEMTWAHHTTTHHKNIIFSGPECGGVGLLVGFWAWVGACWGVWCQVGLRPQAKGLALMWLAIYPKPISNQLCALQRPFLGKPDDPRDESNLQISHDKDHFSFSTFL